MLKKRDAYEERHGKLYEGWSEQMRSAAGGKGAGRGKGEKADRDTSRLQKDKEGNVLPTSKVGCN